MGAAVSRWAVAGALRSTLGCARWCALACMRCALACGLLAAQLLANAADGLVVIDQAQALVTVNGASELSLVELPYHWDRQHPGLGGRAMFEVAFALPAEPSEPYAALLPRVGNRFEIWLNGTLLSRSGVLADAGGADYAKAPRYLQIAPQLLQTNNLLRIELAADVGRRAGLGRVTVGTELAVRALYDASYRWRVAGSLAVFMVMLLTALLATALWLTQLEHATARQLAPAPAPTAPPKLALAQRDRMYGYAALAALCWALRLSNFLIENPPLPWQHWGVLMAVALSGAVFYVVLFSIYVAQWQQHRWARRYERAVPALLLLCAGVASWGLGGPHPQALTLWFIGTTAAGSAFALVYASAALGKLGKRAALGPQYQGPKTLQDPPAQAVQTQRGQALMAASMVINLLVNTYDLWNYRISSKLDDNPLSNYASVLYGLTMFTIVVMRFRSASTQARELLHTLEQRIADKEVALSTSYQQLEVLAREQARSAERTRILRDMHDGVGSHISAAIRQLQSGKATDGQVLTTLRDSLDHLKLSIDAMHLVPGDITALLANMRYRLEPRFTSSGMAFGWDVDLLPLIERLDHAGMRQLQYMVFEALSNVLQHAQARSLQIQAQAQAQDVGVGVGQGATAVLRIIDDGLGFDAQAPVSRGLASMRERANAIGARLVLTSAPGRTVVEIWL